MKKFTIMIAALVAITGSINAQITNSGFENWTSFGNYENPNGWATMNPYNPGPFYSCTKSTDHYPTSVGNYSIRIENNTSLTQFTGGWGMVIADTMAYPFQPAFPIVGHPTSLTGYFKYIPQNSDSMWIQVMLFNNGAIVSSQHINAVSTPNWTSFNIPFPTYATADSATILMAAYYPANQSSAPHGNSVLYVDNLNFDVLINSVETVSPKTLSFDLYPNPASDVVTLNIENPNNSDLTLTIYNVLGEVVSTEKLEQNQRQINVENLSDGIYFVEIKSSKKSEMQKLIIKR